MESLTVALKGIDALVSTVAAAAIENQTILIDAAIAAGVKRFIPSEFGACTNNPKVSNLPIYVPMFKIRQYVEEKGKAGVLTWTVLSCGAFVDFLFASHAWLDFANHKATLFDEGNNRLSATSLPGVGKAIVGILKNFEATKNKIVQVSEVILTQNQLLRIAEDLRPEIKWELSKVRTSVLLKESLDDFATGNFSYPAVMKMISGTAFSGDEHGAAYDDPDNDLLGVQKLREEDLKAIVATKLV